MICPFCNHLESKVIDTRPTDEGTSIRRRRECLSCKKRFTTYEVVEHMPFYVVKKDGSRQPFDKQKLLNGLFRACEKRPVPLHALESVADEVEQYLLNSMEREIPTSTIGELIMKRLKAIDQVAYVRFVSVYRSFEDVDSFLVELNRLRTGD
ncbi:MAG: transcriptional repressor NrdR [Oscillospiraceae bacterium]|nr:transcriptional repressor NrdR [Oscillospiraceae bacterium]